METELKELQEEEEKAYTELNGFIKDFDEKKKMEYWKVLGKLVDIKIELEKHCNQ